MNRNSAFIKIKRSLQVLSLVQKVLGARSNKSIKKPGFASSKCFGLLLQELCRKAMIITRAMETKKSGLKTQDL